MKQNVYCKASIVVLQLDTNNGFEETIIGALVKLKELMTDDLNSPLI